MIRNIWNRKSKWIEVGIDANPNIENGFVLLAKFLSIKDAEWFAEHLEERAGQFDVIIR